MKKKMTPSERFIYNEFMKLMFADMSMEELIYEMIPEGPGLFTTKRGTRYVWQEETKQG